jgi:hypothetical protein
MIGEQSSKEAEGHISNSFVRPQVSLARKAFIILAWITIVAMAALLLNNDPTRTFFLPKCAFHSLTGLFCPGCGGTRALYSLLHGDFLAAIHYNLFAILLAPIIIWLLTLDTGRVFFGWKLRPKPAPAILLWILFWAMLGYGVLRNIPGQPWSCFRP